MNRKRIMIAAPKSGSGKTLVTCALLQALKDQGQKVVSYKCGPDYIDPMYHRQVLGIAAKNLDTFFTGEEKTRELFLRDQTPEDFAVLEGVMGLYDGLGGIREEGSSYHLAKVTDTPIILVIDAKGMGRSIVALLAGFLAYDTQHLIQGVILNRMSQAYYGILKPLIEKECKVWVVGYVPEYREFQIESRHLGLLLPHELADSKTQLARLSQEVQKTVCIETVMQIAQKVSTITQETVRKAVNITGTKPVIAVARDEAFCFYYEDNLSLLREYGAEIIFFSPLKEDKLPADCDALLLGGGYPELHAAALSANIGMLTAVRTAIEGGMPVVAECGGFLYLHDAIVDKEGRKHTMVGTIPHICRDTGKLVRFGYIEIKEKHSSFLPDGACIKGHEFHYYDSEDNGSDCLASKPVTQRSYPCVHVSKTCWLGFAHLYYPSQPAFAQNFVNKAACFQQQRLCTEQEES